MQSSLVEHVTTNLGNPYTYCYVSKSTNTDVEVNNESTTRQLTTGKQVDDIDFRVLSLSLLVVFVLCIASLRYLKACKRDSKTKEKKEEDKYIEEAVSRAWTFLRDWDIPSIEWCLEQGQSLNETSIPNLTRCLLSTDDELCIVAADVLAKFVDAAGDAAMEAENHLIDLLQDEEREVGVRDSAAYALGKICGKKSHQALQPFISRNDTLGKCSRRSIDLIEKKEKTLFEQSK